MIEVNIKRLNGSVTAIKGMAWFDSCVGTGVLRFVEKLEDRTHTLIMEYHGVPLCNIAMGTILGPDHINYEPIRVTQKQSTQVILSPKIVDVIRYIAWTWCSSYCVYDYSTIKKTPSEIAHEVDVTWR